MNLPRAVSPFCRREAFFLGLLIVAVLASRLPFIMHGLDEWDTANFALSLLHFDVLNHQPHPPGQWVYVRLMQAINTFTGNELFTLSLASALCSSLALVPYYFTLRQIFRPAVALGAATVTAFTYGFWVNSLRMISDPVASLFVYGAVCALLAGMTSQRWFLFGMMLCGVALGVKQTALYFLAPFTIALNLLVWHRTGARRPLLGSIVFLVTVATWLSPTVKNCHGWGNYIAACQSMQQENYDAESIIFHLTPAAMQAQWQHNMLQPWGTTVLAAVMLPLVVFGLIRCLRRGWRGMLFGLFGLTVAFYAFFFLYRFNKYYIYYVPVYGAFAAAALFAVGEFLAQRLQRAVLGTLVPASSIALITAVNFYLAAPILPKIAHFRAPPQAALEALRKMPGAGPTPLLLTDDAATTHALTYFHRKKKVNLLILHKDLRKAAAFLNSGRKMYFLSPLTFETTMNQSGGIRLLGRYTWEPMLYDVLQGRPDMRQLSLYEVASPLPAPYSFKDAVSHPPLMQKGMWEDGWCGLNSKFLLPCHEESSDLALLRFTAPGNFGYHYPYRMLYRCAEGKQTALIIKHPGASEFVVPLPARRGTRTIEMQLAAPQTVQPARLDAHLADDRDLAVHLDEVDFVTAAEPLRIHYEEGWYDPETDGKVCWRWTNGNAVLSVLINHPGILVLQGTVSSLSSNDSALVFVDDRQVQVTTVPGQGATSVTWRLPLETGLHHVALRSREPAVQPAGDSRHLALRVQDLQLRLEQP